MIRFAKIIWWVSVIWLVLWLVPNLYDFLLVQPQSTPFTLYSTVTGDFAWIDRSQGHAIYTDREGKRYTESEFDSIFPFFYYRQLMADERFPDTLHGIAVSPRMAQTGSFMFKSTPLSYNAPKIELYPLLESMSGRVDLKMPDDVFRITDRGIEFIGMTDNRVDAAKSDAYTEAMERKGFTFPPQIIAGNPTIKKEYDEGYLMTDKEGQLFHLKQVKGRPYCRHIALPDSLHVAHIFLTEFRDRRFLAFLVDDRHRMYVLYTGSYEIKQVEIPAFDPTREAISIIGNPFDWTLSLTSLSDASLYAIDAATLQCVGRMRHNTEVSLAEKLRQYAMPLRLGFVSPIDPYVFPRINEY